MVSEHLGLRTNKSGQMLELENYNLVRFSKSFELEVSKSNELYRKKSKRPFSDDETPFRSKKNSCGDAT